MSDRPRIADLFCGAGGAGMGLHRAGFEVVGFDIEDQPRYPFEFVKADALDVDLTGFDAVWASPPCQAFVDPNSGHDRGHPDLIAQTRDRLDDYGAPYIIENVDRAPLFNWIMLCGTMFGLLVIRHRRFELSPLLPILVPPCKHEGTVSNGDYAAVYGRGGKGPRGRDEQGNHTREAAPVRPGPEWSEAMGIDWMKRDELTQAIPPAYSQHLGEQLMALLRSEH